MSKILLVDDHADIRRLMRVTLGKTFEILEAEDGVSAFKLAQEHRPDLIVLDVMMPGEIDGLQVLESIKADPLTRDTLVAMITARGQVADHDDARARGADAYFIKPFSPLKLVNRIKELTQ